MAGLALIDAARAELISLLTYGHRRDGALVNRTQRFYRAIKEYPLLPPTAPKRSASSRLYDGNVAVSESHTRWCLSGFKIACGNG